MKTNNFNTTIHITIGAVIVLLIAAIGISAKACYNEDKDAQAFVKEARKEQQVIEDAVSYHASQGRDVDYDGEWIIIKQK